MLNFSKNVDKVISQTIKNHKLYSYSTSTQISDTRDEFKVLNLKNVKSQVVKRAPRKYEVLPPRCEQMPVDQDWGNVWPGPRSFHPAVVPLPIRQGHVKKGAPPGKYANAEIMKIPNFLHLTPPVIKRQCEALKQFCTPWPKNLINDEKCSKHFPIEICSSDYCHSSPTIRDPLSRIVTIKLKLGALNLNARAKDKFLRLVGERYDEKSDILTIVTDRCPTRKQNYDYGMYLITALYHESYNVEAWEELKSEADMEYYDWDLNKSKISVGAIFGGKTLDEMPSLKQYKECLEKYMNDGESDYTINNYGESVRKIFGLPSPQ